MDLGERLRAVQVEKNRRIREAAEREAKKEAESAREEARARRAREWKEDFYRREEERAREQRERHSRRRRRFDDWWKFHFGMFEEWANEHQREEDHWRQWREAGSMPKHYHSLLTPCSPPAHSLLTPPTVNILITTHP